MIEGVTVVSMRGGDDAAQHRTPYGLVAIVPHWLIGLLFIGQAALIFPGTVGIGALLKH
jgi:hypothetical protein